MSFKFSNVHNNMYLGQVKDAEIQMKEQFHQPAF